MSQSDTVTWLPPMCGFRGHSRCQGSAMLQELVLAEGLVVLWLRLSLLCCLWHIRASLGDPSVHQPCAP